MPREFPRPEFLDKHGLETVPLRAGDTEVEINGGYFVDVKEVPPRGLPPHAERKFPDGFVIKLYRNDRPPSQGFFTSSAFEAGTRRDEIDRMLYGKIGLPLLEQRAILSRRHQEIRRYFAGELPCLVVKTSVFVGRDAAGQAIGLYEIQQRLKNFVSPFSRRPYLRADRFSATRQLKMVRAFIADMESKSAPPWLCDWRANVENDLRSRGLDNERLHKLAGEIRAFIRLAADMPKQEEYFRYKFMDIRGADNLIISRDGHLRLIDTNMLFDLRRDGSGERLIYREFQAFLKSLFLLAEHLENFGSVTVR